MHTRWGLCILLAVGPPAFGQEFYSGEGQGTVVREEGVGFRGAPLLDGFYFRFQLNDDRHLRFIEAGADRPFVNRLTAAFGDKNSNTPFGHDPFFYALSFHPRFGATMLGTASFEIAFEEARIELPRPTPRSVFVLRGFRLQYTDADHHVRRLSILEVNGELRISLEGGSGAFGISSSTFTAEVDYAYLPRAMVTERWTRRGEVKKGGADEQMTPRGTSVLAGFDLRFTDDDHHIREVGVWTPDDGRVQVFLSDENGDDPILWTVEGVNLERDRRTGIDRPIPGDLRPPGLDDPGGTGGTGGTGGAGAPAKGRRPIKGIRRY